MLGEISEKMILARSQNQFFDNNSNDFDFCSQ